MKWTVKSHKRFLSHLTLTSVFIIVLNLVASSGNAKVSTPLLEYLKMKRSSRGRPISAVSSDWKSKVWNYLHSLSSAEAPAGYPYKNSNNRKNRKRAGDDGTGEKAGAWGLSFLFPLPIVPRALSFSFSSPSPLHKEASVEERDLHLHLHHNGFPLHRYEQLEITAVKRWTNATNMER